MQQWRGFGRFLVNPGYINRLEGKQGGRRTHLRLTSGLPEILENSPFLSFSRFFIGRKIYPRQKSLSLKIY
jgi:hypothetical protein